MELTQVLVSNVLSRHAHDVCEGFAVEFYHFIIKEIGHGSDLNLIVQVIVLVDFVQLCLQ
jgi:hypothetical protein